MIQTAGAGAWVNAPYQTDTQKLWESLEASRPGLPKPRRPRSSPRQRPMTERSPPRRRQTPGEKALGVPLPPAPVSRPPPSAASKPKPESTPDGGTESAPSRRGAKSSPKPSDRKPRPPSPKKQKARTQRAKLPRQPALVQPEWNSTGPPRRAPGEVANKYTLRGEMGETGSLVAGGGLHSLSMTGVVGDEEHLASTASVADSEFTVATGASRPNRVTGSPTGRMHPNPERRSELRQTDMFTNINYFSPGGAPDNDRKMKEASWMSSQAWFESLRYYPRGAEAAANDDCEATFSGNTHGAVVPSEHLENDVRNRVGVACADPAWSAYQLPEPWAPELDQRMRSLALTTSTTTSTTGRVQA